jgi:hypothetical protein
MPAVVQVVVLAYITLATLDDTSKKDWFHRDLSIHHRDKTRVQMAAKMFPYLKLSCWLFMCPTLGFDTKQRNSFLIKFGVFLQ